MVTAKRYYKGTTESVDNYQGKVNKTERRDITES